MTDLFGELFAYSHHCNLRLAALLIQHEQQLPERPLRQFSHILNAQRIWNNRIQPGPQGFGIWDVHPSEALITIENANHEHTLQILGQYPLNETVDYLNTRGELFTNSVRDMLFHVVNHSTYHRAQIATDLKQQGIEPLTTDYIFYKWKKQ